MPWIEFVDPDGTVAHFNADHIERIHEDAAGGSLLYFAGNPQPIHVAGSPKEIALRAGLKTPMETKCLEIRDKGTFIPVICVRPVPANEGQRYLLRRDGYRGDADETCVILIDAQCRGCAYDPYDWPGNPRTKRVAHDYIRGHWRELADGDVVDVEYILGETTTRKLSERITADL